MYGEKILGVTVVCLNRESCGVYTNKDSLFI